MNGNYGWGLPVRASSYAAKIDWSLNVFHVVMLAIFTIWALYMIFCLVRYRQRDGARAEYSHATPWSSYLPDLVILFFDVWLIFVIGIPLWAHIREELPQPEQATTVRIVAEQFNWNVHYPGPDEKFGKRDLALISSENPLGLDPNDPDGKDDVVSINQLHVPLGKPLLMQLTSKDVIHSFFVPEFRTKQDVVPGMEISMWVEPTMAGHFEIGCAQLCGLGHYRMRGDVLVQTPEEFQQWMDERQAEKVAAAPAPVTSSW